MTRDEVIRQAELNRVRKMVREIRKNKEAGVSHYLEAATLAGDDETLSLLEDALDMEASAGRLYYGVVGC